MPIDDSTNASHPTSASAPRLLHLLQGRMPARTTNHYNTPDRWAIHLHFNHFAFDIGDGSHAITPGMLTITPPGAPSTYRTGSGAIRYLCCHFSASSGTDLADSIPAVLDLGDGFEEARSLLAGAIMLWPTAPQRATLKIWDLLLLAKDRHQANRTSSYHPALSQAIGLIESDLARHYQVGELAEACGISTPQLTRLFKAAFGVGPATYARQRRMATALDLLQHSSESISHIAFALGYDDLHAFNKLCKVHHGKAPSALRSFAGLSDRARTPS